MSGLDWKVAAVSASASAIAALIAVAVGLRRRGRSEKEGGRNGTSHRATAAAVCLSLFVALTVSAGSQIDAGRLPALQGKAALKQAQRDGIDIGAVIETVSHRVESAKEQPGLLVSEDRLYRAEFGAAGFSLTLRRKLVARERAARTKAWRDALAPAAKPTRSARPLPAEAIPFERAPAYSIETAHVLRGSARLTLAPARWRAERNSALRRLVPGISERVTAREGELDWDFLLARAPAGSGALTIEARIAPAGGPHRLAGGRGTSGWRWPVGDGRSVDVGEFVVEDRAGRQLYRALPALARNTLLLTLPARVLRDAVYPLTIDPVVSPEYPVSDPVSGNAPSRQKFPALAFDGTNYLVAWSDFRSGLFSDIYGARVSPGGSVLDLSGLAISTAAYSQGSPALAFDGMNYLVAWSDERLSPGTSTDIYGARVSPGGSVLDASGLAISTAASRQDSPALAFDGTNYLVAWDDRRSGSYNIYGARVSPAGSVLDGTGIAISTAANDQSSPALAFDHTNYLVAWEDSRSGTSWDIYGARVSLDGSVLDVGGLAISTAPNIQSAPALAFDDANYLVAWQDCRSSGQYCEDSDIYGARVSSAGGVLDGSGLAISTAAYRQGSPALAFDGANYLVAWEDWRPDPSGANTDIYGARVSPGGSVLDGSGLAISTTANDQSLPALAFDGTNYLVAWQDLRSGYYTDIYGARVSPAGDVLDGTGLAISTAAYSQGAPALAFDGANYLVAWSDHRSGYSSDIYGARVSPGGSVLDGTGLAISTAVGSQTEPALAFDGTNYLVAWQVCGGRYCGVSGRIIGGKVGYDIYGARVSPAGSVLDPGGLKISTAANWQFSPALAFDGTNYLVAWQEGSDIYGARVSPGGSVLDPGGLAISTAANEQRLPALAFDGTNYLVAWQDLRSGSYDIYGARVSPGGGVLDGGGIAISTAASYQVAPALAFDGANYLVAWEDWRSGTSSDIYGARVSRAGTVFEPFALATADTDERSPAVARAGADRVVAAAYERFAPEPPYGVRRAFLRFVRSPCATRVACPPADRSSQTRAKAGSRR